MEFETPDDARQAREALVASGAMDHVDVKIGPTIAEVAEVVEY